MSHVVLVPVKPPATGKSRLAPLPDDVRRALAEAFAEDTVAAAAATPGVDRVLVVTDDAAFAGRLRASTGCAVLPDGVGGDLNATLEQAAEEAGRRWPGLRPVALCADLPALRPDDLADALSSLRGRRAAFVADAHGVGTTLYGAEPGRFVPRFGPGSRAAHRDAGAHEVGGPLPSLRHDVDDVPDLGQALLLGVGPRTAAVWGRASHAGPAGEGPADGQPGDAAGGSPLVG